MKHRRVFTTLQGESEDFTAVVRFLKKTATAADVLNRTLARHLDTLADAVHSGSTDPPNRQSGSYSLSDTDFIEWVADRLIYRGDRNNADFVIRLRKMAAYMRDHDEDTGTKPEPKVYGGGSSSTEASFNDRLNALQAEVRNLRTGYATHYHDDYGSFTSGPRSTPSPNIKEKT